MVFDFDETLTLATFMTGNCEYADDEAIFNAVFRNLCQICIAKRFSVTKE